MAEAGNKARGAGVGSKTQARRKMVQVVERRHEALHLNETGKAWARGELDSNLKPVNGLGPAGGVELRDAKANMEGHERLRQEHQFDLPPGLVAMKQHMHPEAWDRVLEQRALKLVQLEADSLRHGMAVDQQGYQAEQWYGEQVKAQGAVASGAEQALKERASLPGLTGWAAPNVPGNGVWAELENLRHQVLKAHQSAEALVERLGGALVPAEELVATRVAGPTPPSRLSEEVHLVAVSVVQVQDLLDGLLARLDL